MDKAYHICDIHMYVSHKAEKYRPYSAVDNVPDYRSRGRDFDPGPANTFVEYDSTAIIPLIQEGLLSVTSKSMCG